MQRTLRAAAALVLFLALAATTATRAEIIEQVLLKVNGEIFTKTDLEARQVTTLRQLGQQVDPADKTSDAQLRKMLADITPQLMVNIVDELLLIQRGKELGFSMSDDQFKSIVDNIKKENKLETEGAFQAALTQEGMTMADLRRNLERQMLVSNVTRKEIQDKIAISDMEARAYYDAHVKEFTTSPSVTLREVLITTPAGTTPEVDAEAKRRADAIRARVVAGESIEKLAADLSDSPSRANGGLVGPLSLEDLAPEVRQLIDPLKPGDLTPVLHTAAGYQLLKLETMTARETLPFEKAHEQIGDKVYDGKLKAETRKYLDKLRAQSIIEWKSEDLRKAYEAGLKAQESPAAQPAQQ